MTIRKGKSDAPDIDDLIQDINQENQLSLEENRLEEKIAALKEATTALNAATDRADIIIKGFNKAIDHLLTSSMRHPYRHSPSVMSNSGSILR